MIGALRPSGLVGRRTRRLPVAAILGPTLPGIVDAMPRCAFGGSTGSPPTVGIGRELVMCPNQGSDEMQEIVVCLGLLVELL